MPYINEEKKPNGEVDWSAAAACHAQDIKKLEQASGVRVSQCIQCGKCSAGCPMFHAMDLAPRQVLRYLQLGLYDEVLRARTPWICATCQTCLARCPHTVSYTHLTYVPLFQKPSWKGFTISPELIRNCCGKTAKG